MEGATRRRLSEELGMQSDLKFLFRFKYHAQFGDLGAEHEFCWVYAGLSDDEVAVNPTEIAAWRWIALDELEREMADRPGAFTPWFRLEWERIQADHAEDLEGLVNAGSSS